MSADLDIYGEHSPFHKLLSTNYDGEREKEGIEIVLAHPEIATLKWPGPDDQGKPFIK